MPGTTKKTSLDDGTRVVIRAATPQDTPGLVALFDRLSNETKYMRFMKYRRSISARALAGLLASCGETVAIVADIGVAEEAFLIADGRFIVGGEGGSAEVGIVVQDDYQRMGLGHQMLGLLAEKARGRGIRYFTGEILADNVGMLNFIKKTGYDFEFDNRGTIKRFRIDLRQVDAQTVRSVM
jgi:acetyltransferase